MKIPTSCRAKISESLLLLYFVGEDHLGMWDLLPFHVHVRPLYTARAVGLFDLPHRSLPMPSQEVSHGSRDSDVNLPLYSGLGPLPADSSADAATGGAYRRHALA